MDATSKEFEDLTRFDLDPEMVRHLPEDLCREKRIVLLGRVPANAREVVPLGMLDVTSDELPMDVERKVPWKVRPVQLNDFEIGLALDHGYGTGDEEPSETVFVVGPGAERMRLSPERRVEFDPDQTTEKMVIDALSEAVARRASDVHVEVYAGDVDLRFRIDGVLHEVPTPFSLGNVRTVVSYLKVLADLDIAEHRQPQDGRIGATFTDLEGETRRVDFRVAVLPGPHGEDVVLRVLDENRMHLGLSELGMPEDALDRYRRLLVSPGGMVLVTGPTASGKTTTLYASIREINHDTNKILTVEDPIEYELDHVNQKQVGVNLTFADYSRAFMRQNPDVLMIGEIRDEETASISLRAAQMGHLVLSTMHTRDSASAVARILTLGAERSIIASGLTGVMSQRLVRKICGKCSEEYEPDEHVLARFSTLPDGMKHVRGAGCDECDGTGYHGQTGVFELMTFDSRLRLAVSRGANLALGEELDWFDFPRMYDDAVEKAARGITTVEEVLRAVPFRDEEALRKRRA